MEPDSVTMEQALALIAEPRPRAARRKAGKGREQTSKDAKSQWRGNETRGQKKQNPKQPKESCQAPALGNPGQAAGETEGQVPELAGE